MIDLYLESRLEGLREGRRLGRPADDRPLTPDFRRVMDEKVAQGLDSARQGRLTDGEAVFDRIESEFDEWERDGRH